jgi:hypothetical protein
LHWEQDVPNQILATDGACFGNAILPTKTQLERVSPGILARQGTAGKDRPPTKKIVILSLKSSSDPNFLVR